MQGVKTGGRKAGTPNRVTKELRETLKAVIDRELQQITTTLEALPARLLRFVEMSIGCPLAHVRFSKI